jgi:WD40 repeat protein
MTWSDAQAYAEGNLGNLVTIESAEENQWILDSFEWMDLPSNEEWAGLNEYVWTGYNDLDNDSVYEWSSGSFSAFTNWRAGEPNHASNVENIACINSIFNGLWDDIADYVLIYGLVEREPVVEQVSTINAHSGTIWAVDYSPDGKLIASGGTDNVLKIWDSVSGELLQSLTGHNGWIIDLTFSPDGSQILTAGEDDVAILWDVATGNQIQRFPESYPGRGSSLWSVDFTPDGSKICTGSENGNVKIWDKDSGSVLINIISSTTSVKADWSYTAKFSPDGSKLVTAAHRGEPVLRVWDTSTGNLLHTLVSHTGTVGDAIFSPDSSLIASTSDDGTIKIWNASSGDLINTLNGCPKESWKVRFSPDGSKLLTGSRVGNALLWDVKTGTVLKELTNKAYSVDFAPSGELFAVGNSNGVIEITNNTTIPIQPTSTMVPVATETAIPVIEPTPTPSLPMETPTPNPIEPTPTVNQEATETPIPIIEPTPTPSLPMETPTPNPIEPTPTVNQEATETPLPIIEPTPTHSVLTNNINTVENFPDPNFRAAVEEFMGVEPGGAFTEVQAKAKSGAITARNRGIVSTKGLAYFTGIRRFDFWGNQISEIDISSLQNLTEIDLQNNSLNGIDISNNPGLIDVVIANNLISEIDLTNNPDLKHLNISNNQLREIDLSNLPSLESLDIIYNRWALKSIDTSSNPLLSNIAAESSGIEQLNFSNNPLIAHLRLHGNNLSDLQYATSLNSLESIDIRENNLDCGDWSDVLLISNKIGIASEFHNWGINPPVSGIAFDPQKNIDPFQCGDSTVENINTAENFPDPNFRAAVEEFMGVEPDGVFTAGEASSKTDNLVVSGRDIISVEGLEYFENLTYFDCSNNKITEIDLSKNIELTSMYCYFNDINSLNLNKNTKLKGINISSNPIVDIDFSNNTKLNYLALSYTNVSSLDLSNNINLNMLHIHNNLMLKSLDLTNNINLKEISCLFNSIENISLPDSSHLYAVDIRNNLLDYSFWDVITNLRIQLGEPIFKDEVFIEQGFAFSPQQNYDPYDGNVDINSSEYIPEINLLTSIREFMGVDENGIVTMADAFNKEGVLDISGQTIRLLIGIQYFANIDGLIANNCSLRAIQHLLLLPDIGKERFFDISYNNINFNQIGSVIQLILQYGEDNVIYSPQNTKLSTDVTVYKWDYNNHYYAYIKNSSTWNWESSLTYSNKLDGYLATITSQEENDFIVTKLGSENIFWCVLGGYQEPEFIEDDPEKYSQGWKWVTGEEWGYTNWDIDEPNQNEGNEEDITAFLRNGEWNDGTRSHNEITGFIIEWETPPQSNALFNFIINQEENPDYATLGGNSIQSSPGEEIAVSIPATQLATTSGFSFELVFDDAVLEWAGEILKENSMIDGWSFVDANLIENDRLIVAAFGADEIEGDGILLNLKFKVNESAPLNSSTSLNIENPDGLGAITLKPITIEIGGMLGDLDGNQRITISDVQTLFNIVLKRIEPTSAQSISGDINKDGRISISDVQILFDVVLQRTTLPAKVTTNLIHPMQTSTVSIGSVNGNIGSSILVPVYVSSSSTLSAFEMSIAFDSQNFEYVGLVTADTLSEPFTFVDGNAVTEGDIIIAGLHSEPITPDGILVYVEFQIQDDAKTGVSEMIISNVDGDLLGWNAADGLVSIQNQSKVMNFLLH